jgi:hypothetical protein
MTPKIKFKQPLGKKLVSLLRTEKCHDKELISAETKTLFLWSNGPNRALAANVFRFLDHTQLDTHTL